MLAHNVYFWLKEGLSDKELAAFERGLESLIHETVAKGGHYGKPAATDREVVENSYSYGLILIFDDLAAHDRYQSGQVHRAFVAAYADRWERVLVYDFEAEL